MIVLAVKDFAAELGRWVAIVLGRDKPYRPMWVKSRQRWSKRLARSFITY